MSVNSAGMAQATSSIAYHRRALSAFEQARQAQPVAGRRQGGDPGSGHGGDSIDFSESARQSLAQARQEAHEENQLYDRSGQLDRQLASLHGSLNSLAGTLRQMPRNAGIAAYVNSMQSRLSSLEMQV